MSRIVSKHGGLGWIPQRPDIRDREYLPTLGHLDMAGIPHIAMDVSGIPTLNQGRQGSCTGHGPTGLIMFDQQQQNMPIVEPSPAFIYWNARAYEGTTNQDSGAQVRDAVKGVVNYGAPPNSEFPYSDQVYDQQPSQQVFDDAVKQKALVYESVAYPHVDRALASGFPVVCGATLYESFESDQAAQTGVIPIPKQGEPVIGGHCFWLWGFNSSYHEGWTTPQGKKLPPRSKACRNSWGTNWGDGGDFYLPQFYFDHGLVTDFWVIRRIA